MKSGSRPRYTLEASIKAGESKLQDKCVRGSNKGITQINTFPGAAKVEQIFISHNQIATLDGVQNFKNLRVLSISFNEISKISDLKFLNGLRLETINLEGNPITKQPYYQHHVVSVLPHLSLFDGKAVNESLRAKAQAIVDFDTQRLTDLCVNEARLAQMDALLKGRAGMSDAKWKDSVEKMLDPDLTLASFNMSEAEISDAFDKMRQVAVDLRKKQGSAKWADVYNTIEDVQRKATQELSAKLAAEIQNLSAATPQLQSDKKKKRQQSDIQKTPISAFLMLEKMVTSDHGATPPTQMRIENKPSIMSSGRSIASEASSVYESEATMPLDSALVIPQKPATPVRDDRAERFVEHLGTILERTRAKASLTKSFFNWKCRARRQVVVLGSENGKLLEQAQECITRIAVLETELDQTRREKREIAAALEDSVKNETKMAAVAQRLNQEKDALERSLKASERKYEEDVLQFILETKFNSDSRISRAVNLEAEIRKLQLERNSLQEFIRESQDEHKRQIDALNAKLQSAFDVASGFRREISKLKSASIDSSPPPYSPPSVGSARASGYALGNF